MKNKSSFIALVLLALLTLNSPFSTACAQGSLTPPGAPAPTMITLNQMEPRTPISSAPYSIMKPGSYYLTTNITVTSGDAIDIGASGVTLDLNGFTISSTSPFESGRAIYISFVSNGGNYFGFTDITISNGHITGGITNNAGVYGGPGFGFGIGYFQAPPAPPYNVRVTGVTVSGCANSGVNLGTDNSTVVESCTVNSVGGSGIIASSVSHSTAIQCGNVAITASAASDCYASSTGSIGLVASYVANNCIGSGNGSGDGLAAGEANNCYGYSNGTGNGLSATTANNCYGYNNANGNGLSATTANNCYGNVNGAGTALSAVTANGCYGYSGSGPGSGLSATSANNCYGECDGDGIGLDVSGGVAIGCTGVSGSPESIAINALIANSCVVPYDTTTITYKYNMP